MSDHYSHDEGGHYECRRYGDCDCKCSVCRGANAEHAKMEIDRLQGEIKEIQTKQAAAQLGAHEARREDIRQIYNDIWTETAPADCTWLGRLGKQRLTILQAISTEEGRLAYLDAVVPQHP